MKNDTVYCIVLLRYSTIQYIVSFFSPGRESWISKTTPHERKSYDEVQIELQGRKYSGHIHTIVKMQLKTKKEDFSLTFYYKSPTTYRFVRKLGTRTESR